MVSQSKHTHFVVTIDGKEFEFHNPYNLPYYKKAVKALEALGMHARRSGDPAYHDAYASLLASKHLILGVDGSVVFVRFYGGPKSGTLRDSAIVVNDLTGTLKPLNIYFPMVRAYN